MSIKTTDSIDVKKCASYTDGKTHHNLKSEMNPLTLKISDISKISFFIEGQEYNSIRGYYFYQVTGKDLYRTKYGRDLVVSSRPTVPEEKRDFTIKSELYLKAMREAYRQDDGFRNAVNDIIVSELPVTMYISSGNKILSNKTMKRILEIYKIFLEETHALLSGKS